MTTPETTPGPLAATVWRTKLRSTKKGVDHGKQETHCFEHNRVGIGWGVNEVASGAPAGEVIAAIQARPDWGKGSAATVRRFADDVIDGDFIWVRDQLGLYRLGRFSGPYRYENDEVARAVDIHQVRGVEWLPVPLTEIQVPAGVIRSFIGRQSSFSRIHDEATIGYTPVLWAIGHGEAPEPLDKTRSEVIEKVLAPFDVEDLVFAWLQVTQNVVLLPSTHSRSTPVIEGTLLSRDGEPPIILQVKTGDAHVDLEQLRLAAGNEPRRLFAYATCGGYNGDVGADHLITTEELAQFTREFPTVVPPRIRGWLDLALDQTG